MKLFKLVVSEPGWYGRGLVAFVKAPTLEDARAKVARFYSDADDTLKAELIHHGDVDLGLIDEFEYAIFEYWE